MGCLPHARGICPYGVQEHETGRLTGWFPAGAGGTRGAPGDDGPYPVNWSGGNISGPPQPPWGKLYPCHDGL